MSGKPMTSKRPIAYAVKCDGNWRGCLGSGVTYIDAKGFAYCAVCGPVRKGGQPCRQLRPYEQRELQMGRQIHYKVKPASYYAQTQTRE